MDSYLFIKTLHILSSVLMVGTGFGSAFYLFFANRGGKVVAQAEVARLVVRADLWFTTPAVIFQPLSGLWLMEQTGFSFSQFWIFATLALYTLAACCWLPVLWLQHRMYRIADAAARSGAELGPVYWRYAKYWEYLGYPAFVAMLAIYGLMVFKPA